MNGPIMSLDQDPSWHPVHRANELLRQALLNSAPAAPDPAEIWDDGLFSVDAATTEIAHGPVGIMDPASLSALFGVTSIDDAPPCQRPVTWAHDGRAANASPEEALEGDNVLDHAAELQLQKLVQAFYRRQRQASMLVAASIAFAIFLTFAGFILLLGMTGTKADAGGRSHGASGTDAAHRAAVASSLLEPAKSSAPHASLLIRAKADATPPALQRIASQTDVILAAPQRPLSLGPLLPVGSARYLLLRGLPKEAELSAGRRTAPGTWMVKDGDVPNLTLTLADGASGDYPVDVYLLEASDGLQGRRRLILRVDETPKVHADRLGLGWALPVPEASQNAPAAQPAAAPKETSNDVRLRAQTLFARGDIASARRLLSDLATRGDAEAAYELALTYDADVLARAGIQDVDADAGKARAWYRYAAQAGHAGAAQRLQMLATPRAGA